MKRVKIFAKVMLTFGRVTFLHLQGVKEKINPRTKRHKRVFDLSFLACDVSM